MLVKLVLRFCLIIIVCFVLLIFRMGILKIGLFLFVWVVGFIILLVLIIKVIFVWLNWGLMLFILYNWG